MVEERSADRDIVRAVVVAAALAGNIGADY